MPNQNEARGLIAAKASRIEALLRELGGQGKGLKELSSNVAYLLDDETLNLVRKVYVVRNRAVHESTFEISQKNLDRYSETADALISLLERKQTPFSAPPLLEESGVKRDPIISVRRSKAKYALGMGVEGKAENGISHTDSGIIERGQSKIETSEAPVSCGTEQAAYCKENSARATSTPAPAATSGKSAGVAESKEGVRSTSLKSELKGALITFAVKAVLSDIFRR
ncbi:hypothetical protein KC131_25880 [Pseudomonas sp. JQ170]|uniref:hypothetical protein n=1 Tax=unclassified Pseudomonas TaxID=196821 RepID=UPI0026531535|nr:MULTISPECIES: hypothetical protein [unclassified Pseudomonas]MDN7144079.1 hypothetical protein [Pseudomonas sp. JQ170]WRO74202.1 hypothetical protein U9R80_16930 [Pseudomonas sp. 170C]